MPAAKGSPVVMKIVLPFALAAALLAACGQPNHNTLYEKVAVTRTTIVVSASAAGVIEPVRTVEVKSKASGEIMQLNAETGDNVKAGKLLAIVDPRQPRNALAQAEADVQVARAQLEINKSKLDRADALFKSSAITEVEYEDARLAYVSANAQVVRAQTDLEIARDQMDDTRIVAPVDGTIIAKYVEPGTVISSPTKDVGGGTLLLTMANLDTVQIRTRVDETDIGKVRPGMAATITVDAYPNHPFSGHVLKIEPQATVEQNVTMFPALVRIANPGHLLMPGMNAEVEVHIGRREDVVAVPYAALRTRRDIASAARVLGLDPGSVEEELARAPAAGDSARAAGTERPAAGPGRRGGGAAGFIVFVLRGGRPVPTVIQTGLTDLDWIEVLAGVAPGDTVAVLPSASLVASQEEMRARIQRLTGGGLPGVQQQGGQTPPPRRQP